MTENPEGFGHEYKSVIPYAKEPSIRLWPIVINLWIASVLVLFLLIRVAGSNAVKHLFSSALAH